MTPRELFIPVVLPNLNDVIHACKTHYGVYSSMKKKWGCVVRLYALQQRFEKITEPAHWEYTFYEPNRRRDPSNLAGGAIKILEDALQEAGLLENDGWEQVLSISSMFRVSKEKPGVLLRVT